MVPPHYNLPVNLDDTIVAIATPPGRGGIGVVRLAGPEARTIAAPMLRLKQHLEPGHAIFGELIEPDHESPRDGRPRKPALSEVEGSGPSESSPGLATR